MNFLSWTKNQTKKNSMAIFFDVTKSSIKYNISLLDYFYFRFYEKEKKERASFAGTGFMYEYQLKMNPISSRDILEDKILFNQIYHKYVNRLVYSFEELKNNQTTVQKLLENPSGKIVLKGSKGQVGAEVEIIRSVKFNQKNLLAFMISNNFDLAEEFVTQHSEIMSLSDSGLNTIRVFSQLDEHDKVHFLGARLRITVNSEIDNMAAGNLAAPIDISTGIISGAAVYSDITKEDELIHPISKKEIIGFQIPYWKETLQLIIVAALLRPENRSIGWDVAITEKGPELIEGNHNWCKLLWQLPVKKGLKAELEKYL